jgi:hypothetical protein
MSDRLSCSAPITRLFERSGWPVILFFSLVLAGCQQAAEAPIEQIEEYVTVRMAANGPPKRIPRRELLDPSPDAPKYHSVLAIDRQARRQAWVELDQLRKQHPTMARYIPLTQPTP